MAQEGRGRNFDLVLKINLSNFLLVWIFISGKLLWLIGNPDLFKLLWDKGSEPLKQYVITFWTPTLFIELQCNIFITTSTKTIYIFELSIVGKKQKDLL